MTLNDYKSRLKKSIALIGEKAPELIKKLEFQEGVDNRFISIVLSGFAPTIIETIKKAVDQEICTELDFPLIDENLDLEEIEENFELAEQTALFGKKNECLPDLIENLIPIASGFYNKDFGYFQIGIKKLNFDYKKNLSENNQVELLALSVLIIVLTHLAILEIAQSYKFFEPNCKDLKILIYAHNGGRFDFILLLNALLNTNTLVESNFVIRNNKIMSFKGKIGDEEKLAGEETLLVEETLLDADFSIKFEYRDSFDILSLSLEKLIKTFLPNTPSAKIKEGSPMGKKFTICEFFTSLEKKRFHQQFDEYLKNDCIALYDILIKCDNNFIKLFQISIFESLTMSSLSKQIFYRNFYKETPTKTFTVEDASKLFGIDIKLKKIKGERPSEIIIDVIDEKQEPFFIFPNDRFIDLIVRSAFHGGRVSLFIPSNFYDKDSKDINSIINHYDVNSLFPFATTVWPLPFGRANYFKLKNPTQISSFYNTAAFCLAEIVFLPQNETNDLAVPVLPVKLEGENIYAYGVFKGWYYSSILQSALKAGYQIIIYEIIAYKPNVTVLSNFMTTIYKDRQAFSLKALDESLSVEEREEASVQAFIKKAILNGLYGIFAISIGLIRYKILPKNKLNELKKNYDLKETFSNNLFSFVNFDTLKNKKVSLENTYNQNTKIFRAAPHISAAITANANRYMFETFLKKGAYTSILYTDTDSIIIKDSKDFIKQKMKHLIDPTELGCLKKENVYLNFFAPAKKVWFGIFRKKQDASESLPFFKHTLKFRGIPNTLLNSYYEIPKEGTFIYTQYNKILTFFKNLLQENPGPLTEMIMSDQIRKSVTKGSLESKARKVVFDPNSILKSDNKEFNKERQWIRTTPYYIFPKKIEVNETETEEQLESNLSQKTLEQSYFKYNKENFYQKNEVTQTLNDFSERFKALPTQRLSYIIAEEIKKLRIKKINDQLSYLLKQIKELTSSIATLRADFGTAVSETLETILENEQVLKEQEAKLAKLYIELDKKELQYRQYGGDEILEEENY